MATDFDPYRILGIDRTAFSDDIYNAYQRALAEHHNDPDAQREIEAAYAILGNIEQRREYDARLRERELTGAVPPAPDAIAATGAPTSAAEVRWTLGDIAKALFLPMLLVGANIIAGFVDEVDTDDFTEGDFITAYVFTIILEIALLGLAWHFGLRKHKLSWRAFGFHWPKTMRWWFPFAITGAALVSIWAYVGFLALVGADTEGNVPENAFDYVIPVILLGLLSVIVAPVVEEIFFRSFLYQGFAKAWGVPAGIAVSALIFGSFHIGGPDTLLVAPAIVLIGGIFAWGFSRHGSVYPGIIAHFIFNGISFVVGVLSA